MAELIQGNLDLDISSCYKRWSARSMSVFGLKEAWNTYIAPRFLYKARLTATPKSVCQKLNKLAFKLLWKGKQDPIRRSTIHYPWKCGGLGVIDIDARKDAFRLLILKNVIHNEKRWGAIARAILETKLPDLFPILPGPASQDPDIFPYDRPRSSPVLSEYCKELVNCHRKYGHIEGIYQKEAKIKQIYELLLEAKNDAPVVMAVRGDSFPSDVRRLKRLPLFPAIKTLTWKLLYNIIPTGERLLNRKVIPLDKSFCARCKNNSAETLDHLVFDCSTSEELWRHIRDTLGDQFAPERSRDSFFTMTPHHVDYRTDIIYIWNLALFSIWSSRNEILFEQKLCSPLQKFIYWSNYHLQYLQGSRKQPQTFCFNLRKTMNDL